MSDCIPNNENEKIQKHYQMLLLLEQFQVVALKERESMQQGISDKYNFYKQVKKVNQIDRELKQIKKKCVKQLKK